jgi:hypothetical protein
MKIVILSALFLFADQHARAQALTWGGWTPDRYEVLFSNPVCPAQNFVSYRPRNPAPIVISNAAGDLVKISPQRSDVPMVNVGPEGIPTLGGGFRKDIPANVYCDTSDFLASTRRGADNPYRKTDSPLNRIEDWVSESKSGDELFVASFSLSMGSVADWICDAAKRGVKTKVFIHEPERTSGAYVNLKSCPGVELLEFASEGRLAHMKSVMVVMNNPEHGSDLQGKVRVSFQSGNISTGTWGHQENWNFVTQDRGHWFSQDHICLRDAITSETVGNLGKLYNLLDDCRAARGIDALRRQDDQMQSFFIPKSGGVFNDRRELKTLLKEIPKARRVWIAAHHLTEPDLIKALALRLKAEPGQFDVRIIIDSELFWANYEDKASTSFSRQVDGLVYGESDSLTSYCQYRSPAEEAREQRCSLFSRGDFGDSIERLLDDKGPRSNRAWGPRTLALAGAQLKMFESNHLSKMLFHNKFIVFEYKEPEGQIKGSVFTGAGNLSKSGFERNFENYYLMRIPHVFAAFQQQFLDLFLRAQFESDLPLTWDYSTTDGELRPYAN